MNTIGFRYNLKMSFGFVFCFSFLVSCNTPSELGADFLEGGRISLAYIDTLTLRASTVVFDSLATSNSGRLLFGYVEDPRIGAICSSPCFQIEPPSVSDNFGVDFTYDYLALRLEYDRYSYYDTTQLVKLNVFEIDEDIELEDDGSLYNNKVFRKKQLNGQYSPIGSVSFYPFPHRYDTVEVRLPDSLGKQLFQWLIDGDDRISSKTEFQNYFKGIILEPDTTLSSSILGFKPSASLRLHYVNAGTPKKDRYVDFSIGSSIYYNKIISDKEATPLSTLVTREEGIRSTKTDNTVYFSNALGLAVRVEIPHLRSILSFDKNLIVSQAQLKIVPLNNSYDDNTDLPSSFAAMKVDKFNDFIQSYQNSLLLKKDELLDRDTHYAVDITQFVKEQLKTDLINQNAILFIPNKPGSSADRVYAGDSDNKYGMELRVYYSHINQ
jgi:hypothetical protein